MALNGISNHARYGLAYRGRSCLSESEIDEGIEQGLVIKIIKKRRNLTGKHFLFLTIAPKFL